MASKTLASGKKVLVGSKADPSSKNYDTTRAVVTPKKETTHTVNGGTVGSTGTNQYQYVDTSKNVRTINANSPEEATASAADRAPTSGVALYTPTADEDVTSSSGDSRADETKLGTEIKTLSAPEYDAPTKFQNSSYIKDMEDSIRQNLSLSEKMINADFDEIKATTQAEQKGEVGQTSAMLARVGGYLGNSGSGNGVVLSLAASHRAELLSLEAKRQKALSEARIAYQDKRFDVAELKLNEAKDYEQEVYDRQQDFFNNTIKATSETRTATNQVRDDARAILTNIISSANGQAFEELDAESQALLTKNAVDAGYPLSVVKSLLEAPKAEQTKIDSLIKIAVGKGAPAELLDAAAASGSYVEAAKVLAPYLAANSGTGDSLKVSFIPATLQGPVSSLGVSSVYDSLISNGVPSWFAPVIQATGAAASMNIDPSSSAAQDIWNEFKSLPEVQAFKKQVDKKIGLPVTVDYGVSDTSVDVTE